MLIVIGASSLDRAIKVAKHPIQIRHAGKYFTDGGLGFYPNNRNPLKVLQKLLVRGSLRNRSNLVIWHDVISYAIIAHHSNYEEPCTAVELLEIIEPFKPRISANFVRMSRRKYRDFSPTTKVKNREPYDNQRSQTLDIKKDKGSLVLDEI